MKTNYLDVLNKIENINPIKYSSDRNYLDGSVSQLSPYISRGLISTKFVFQNLIRRGYQINKIEKFVQELAWRDYWQLTWKNRDINSDLRNQQTEVLQFGIPDSILNHNTNIHAIDSTIMELYQSGYIHNHSRMYIASIVTNIGKYHWYYPAKWMYYYLLDADWGSNALSWQWICGTNSNKKYYANQDNINKFTKTNQKKTIIDSSYINLIKLQQPEILKKSLEFSLTTIFPKSDFFENKNSKPICIYNFYNLDLNWRNNFNAHRILLIEPSIFKKHPISANSIQFMLDLSKNILGIKVFVGEFEDLPINNSIVYFKEHPLNYNYKGVEDPREWLSNVNEEFSSFFKFWNKVRLELANY
jgi:deoxyribodipyrimidine photo-lyase